ncbi:MAG: Gfo/Idh/MocA family oxidoreductase [Clostridiales bacterium]|nr:Gfo/Idh/MocA family oxidoreductase [Clostridiales bacterium]
MKSRKGIALIGFGGMGAYHSDRLKLLDEVKITGIFDIDPARAKFAESLGLRAYASQEELLSDDEALIVLVATPNDSHKPISIDAMNHGKHVICEKPVALSSVELKDMLDCANKNGVIFSTHQNRRWDEDYLLASELCAGTSLGTILSIESRVHGCRGIPGDWRKVAAQGGGMVFDWGVHIIDQMLCMMKGRKIESLYTRLSYVLGEEVDDGFSADFQFEGNIRFRLEVSTINYIGLPRWYIQGTEGTAVIEGFGSDARALIPKGKVAEAKPVVTAAGVTKTMAPRDPSTMTEKVWPKPTSDASEYYRNFIAAISGEEKQIVTHMQMLRVFNVIEKMMESGKQNVVIKNL